MFKRFFKKRRITGLNDAPGPLAGELFASGLNCCQAVFQATTGRSDAEIMQMAKAFGGGIGDRKCLCGAVTGGVMALGACGRGHMAGELVDRFRKTHGATCCAALSREYRWKSREHLNNCRRITQDTAENVAELLQK